MSIFGNLFAVNVDDNSALFGCERLCAEPARSETAGKKDHTISGSERQGRHKQPRLDCQANDKPRRRASKAANAVSSELATEPQSSPTSRSEPAARVVRSSRPKAKRKRDAGEQIDSLHASAEHVEKNTRSGARHAHDSPQVRAGPSPAIDHSSDPMLPGTDGMGPEQAESRTFTAEQLTRTIFVGNVSVVDGQKQAIQKLKAFFKQHGDVESVRLRNVPVDTESKMPKALQIKAGKVCGERGTASAYVRFAAADAVEAALASNMTLLQGAHIRVDRAALPSRHAGSVQYEPKRSVFLGNLPFDTQEEDVIALFNTASHEPQLEGAVEAVRLVRDGKTNVGKGIGYVLLRSRLAVLAALNLNGTECKGRKMRVVRVKASAGGANAQKVEGSRKGRAGPGAGRKGAVAAQRVGGNADDFSGTRTKGKKKGVSKTAKQNEAPPVQAGAVSKPRAAGKRPAVAARKAKQLLAAGKLSAKDAKSVDRAAKQQRRAPRYK